MMRSVPIVKSQKGRRLRRNACWPQVVKAHAEGRCPGSHTGGPYWPCQTVQVITSEWPPARPMNRRLLRWSVWHPVLRRSRCQNHRYHDWVTIRIAPYWHPPGRPWLPLGSSRRAVRRLPCTESHDPVCCYPLLALNAREQIMPVRA